MTPDHLFIGAACDSKFVELTSAMLSSVDDNGDVPEATIVLAGFGLSRADKRRLRLSAGRLGKRMRFLPITRESRWIPALPSFDFPLPLLGGLLAPKAVDVAGVRMLLLDSDIIVNSSLAPLFGVDMEGHPIAAMEDMLAEYALHARGRQRDPTYFNAGVVLIDVDAWNARSLSDASMRRLAAYPERPEWLEQDAMNEVIGDDWLRIDRSWNFAYMGEERQWTFEEYSAARIIHYAGAKPTEARDHPAVPIYDHHAERAAQKAGRFKPNRFGLDREFVATAYEVLLGRELEGLHVLSGALLHPPETWLASLLSSPEFRAAVLDPLGKGEPLPSNRFRGRPRMRQRFWAQDRLPILAETYDRLDESRTWHELLSAIVADERMMGLAGLPPVSAARAAT